MKIAITGPDFPTGLLDCQQTENNHECNDADVAASHLCHVAALLAIIIYGKGDLVNACYVNRNGS